VENGPNFTTEPLPGIFKFHIYIKAVMFLWIEIVRVNILMVQNFSQNMAHEI
jgi:hypothetical protein